MAGKRADLKKMLSTRLILASASPQRRKIFMDAGLRFEIADPGDVEDAVTHAHTPEELALAKARAKARVIASACSGPALVVGADTLVVADGKVIGKPVDRTDAAAILSHLSGTQHRVLTGVCAIPIFSAQETVRANGADRLEFCEVTLISMRRLSAAEIAAYVDSGEADGKAGAYGVQETGDKFIERMDGSFLNVVGFPMEKFRALLPDALKSWGMS